MTLNEQHAADLGERAAVWMKYGDEGYAYLLAKLAAKWARKALAQR